MTISLALERLAIESELINSEQLKQRTAELMAKEQKSASAA